MDFEKQLDTYLRARFTLLVLVTSEEERLLQSVRATCEQSQRVCLTWDAADFFQYLTPAKSSPPVARDPITALEQVEKFDTNTSAVFLFKDFHDLWSNPQIKRKLRSLVQRLKFTKKHLLISTHIAKVPEELKDEAVIINYPLPDAEHLSDVLNRLVQTPGVNVKFNPARPRKTRPGRPGPHLVTGTARLCTRDRHGWFSG